MVIFSPDYFTARERFRTAAQAAGAQLESHAITARGPKGEALGMDVAVLGAPSPSATLLLSSGLHGVEGFAGSAVQTAWLESLENRGRPPPGVRVVLVHALNPYGFAWRRRVNENNVDLNRNFLPPDAAYSGAPGAVQVLADFIAPRTPPDPPWLTWRYWPQAAIIVARHGMRALRGALTQGQYEYPQGLFYGGRAPEETTRIVRRQFGTWTAGAGFVLHLDFHTGLGPRGVCTLFSGSTPQEARWLSRNFPGNRIEQASAGLDTALTGGMGDSLAGAHAGDRYVFATAEFGTCSGLAAFRALREENRAHRFPGHAGAEPARRRLMQCFCPDDEAWRCQVVQRGITLVGQGLQGCARCVEHM